MDFQYDYDNEESSKDKDEEMSKDENKRMLEDESEESLKESFENEKSLKESFENEKSSEDSEYKELSEDSEYKESLEEFSEYENKEYLEDEDEELSSDKEIDNDYDDEIEDESSEDEKNIIDKALEKDKMPSYNNDNEFAPYFENFTTTLLFCWIQKYNISTSAYEDLVKIIHNPQFVSIHVIKNIRRFHKWRQHLPLLSISARSISISSKKTPSTSKDLKMSYQLSINDII